MEMKEISNGMWDELSMQCLVDLYQKQNFILKLYKNQFMRLKNHEFNGEQMQVISKAMIANLYEDELEVIMSNNLEASQMSEIFKCFNDNLDYDCIKSMAENNLSASKISSLRNLIKTSIDKFDIAMQYIYEHDDIFVEICLGLSHELSQKEIDTCLELGKVEALDGEVNPSKDRIHFIVNGVMNGLTISDIERLAKNEYCKEKIFMMLTSYCEYYDDAFTNLMDTLDNSIFIDYFCDDILNIDEKKDALQKVYDDTCEFIRTQSLIYSLMNDKNSVNTEKILMIERNDGLTKLPKLNIDRSIYIMRGNDYLKELISNYLKQPHNKSNFILRLYCNQVLYHTYKDIQDPIMALGIDTIKYQNQELFKYRNLFKERIVLNSQLENLNEEILKTKKVDENHYTYMNTSDNSEIDIVLIGQSGYQITKLRIKLNEKVYEFSENEVNYFISASKEGKDIDLFHQKGKSTRTEDKFERIY